MADVDLTRRQAGKIQNLITGILHNIQVKTRFPVHMVEMEDVNFHHDSAVLLPDYAISRPVEGASEEQDRITGLAVLYACYRHARENPDQSLLVIGHTDRSGPRAYNQTLSELRAKNVRFALQGDRTRWVESTLQKNKVEDYQQILIWLTHSLGWNCDPGPKDNKHGPDTTQAVQDFKRQYNDRFSASLVINGTVNRETWGAFFDVYMDELKHTLGTDDGGLENARQSLRFLTCESIGCGEDFPITPDRQENYKNAIDRRVEILFFDPGEEPVLNCSQPGPTCNELYGLQMYDPVPVPVDPLPLPSGVAVHTFLKFVFSDPEGTERSFPEGCPITIVFEDGTEDQRALRRDGVLDFFPLREKRAFTVEFRFEDARYMATPADGSSDSELIAGDQLQDFLSQGFRVFMLPTSPWGLANAKWTVEGTDHFDEGDHHFRPLDDMSVTAIGSEAAPVQMRLDPCWQYLKLLYFDRFLGERLSIPRVMLEGFRDAADTASPDTRSNWTTPAEACQCLPWILQDPPKPDADVLIQLRTAPGTFIDSSGSDRKLVTKSSNGSVPAFSPELNIGDPINRDFNLSGPDRLKFYDLPAVWKSRTYFTRLSGGTDQPAEKEGRFEDLASETTTDAKPLLFSLDDIVLTDLTLTPIQWQPDDQIENRYALFCNTFEDSGPSRDNLGKNGLYKPDGAKLTSTTDASPPAPFTGNNLGFFTQVPQVESNRNYIADYPEWTRIVIALGDIFDVFDQRMPDVDGQVVGARAGVRWVQAMRRVPGHRIFFFNASGTSEEVTEGDAIVHPGRFYHPRKPGPITPTRPDGIQHRFFVIQPFFEQQYIRVSTSLDTGSYDFRTNPDIPGGNRARTSGIGRFDLVMLRCCGVDGEVEKSVALKFFKFNFDFARAPASLSGDAARKQYVEKAVMNIPLRWNGPDGVFNPEPPIVKKRTPSEDLETKVLWCAQAVEHDRAHFKIEVVPNQGGRSFMNSQKGNGELRESAHQDEGAGRLVIAHECGHGGSLPDEYSEKGTKCSYFQAPLRSNNIVSDFYSLDARGMMNSNRDVRGRYFWHAAEWLRRLYGGSYKIIHDGHECELPEHPSSNPASPGPSRNFVNWPLRAEINTRAGTMDADARADVLFYALGADKFSAVLLKPGIAFKGAVVIMVKMKISFPTKPSFTPDGTLGRIRSDLQTLNARLASRFNKRWRVTGSVGGLNFEDCLVHFAFRYLVTTVTNESNDENTKFLSQNGGSVAGYNTLAANLERDHDVHLEIEVKDPPGAPSTGLSGNKITLRSNNYNQFDTLVTRFLGMSTAAPPDGGAFPAPAQVLPLVRKVMNVSATDIQTL